MTGGYLEQRRRLSPASLAAVVAAHLAIIGALALSVTHGRQIGESFTPLIDYETPPPPPPQPPTHTPRTPHPESQAARPIDNPTPTVDTHPLSQETQVTLPPLTPIFDQGGTPTGTGTGPETAKTIPTPVLADATIDPRYAGAFQPDYPPSLEREGIEGKAVVRVRIGTDGRVAEVQQVSADDPAFFAATERQALRHWRFKPATRDGVAVETWKTMTVTFRLQQG